MRERVRELSTWVEPQMIRDRRDFHRYAETGWTEFRTASKIARRLTELGWRVRAGREAVRDEDRMGLPDQAVLDACWERALSEGGDPEFLELMRGGFTGLVADWGEGDGPMVGLRFDMDALELTESEDPAHRPAREGFASVHPEATHACGHDGHVAIGLGLAYIFANLDAPLPGRVRLIFQPAEEGVRGAKSMVGAGAVDGVDVLLGLHLYSRWATGQVVAGRSGYLATTKFDALIQGAAAHAGGSPHEGNNALLAAATAVLNLHAIPRHRDGITRINVGRLNAGTGRNIICPRAHLAVETRGATEALDTYMVESARRILEAAAAMYGCSLEIRTMGSSGSAESDAALVARVEAIAKALGGLSLREIEGGGGSEDYTVMMRHVQASGGLATHIGLGADLGQRGHHTPDFDFDERALKLGAMLLGVVTLDVMENPLG